MVSNDVSTVWVSETFTDPSLIEEFAILFSEWFNIIESPKWANMIVENGLDGAPKGIYREGVRGERNGMFGKTGEQNPFYGKKHSAELKEKWREMRLGDRNPNYQGKSFTEKTYELLRRPKQNKENYKGSPGLITCIGKDGKTKQITCVEYHKQKEVSPCPADWEFVNVNSKEAKNRKYKQETQ